MSYDHLYLCGVSYDLSFFNEMISFIIAAKIIKIVIRLPKEIKELYSESYKILMKEIKNDTNRDIYHVLGLKESIL